MRRIFRKGLIKKEAKGGQIRIFFGLFIMAISFYLLWTNEGRVNLASIARKSHQIEGNILDPAFDEELVAVTGQISTPENIDDNYYLRPGEYVQIHRWVEMFAWVEERESDEDGDEYYYELKWTEDPQPPSAFYWPEEHENPNLEVRSDTFTVDSANIGQYRINSQQIQLPRGEPIILSFQNVKEGPYQIDKKYIFEGSGTLTQPVVGDIRVSFSALPANIQVTVFGRQRGEEIVPFYHQNDIHLLRVLIGDRNQALERLDTEYNNLLWGFRFLGFSLMWLGFYMIFSPLTLFLRSLPGLRDIGRWMIAAITFITAIILSSITVLISAIVHNVWASLIMLILAVSVIYFWQKRESATK